MTWCSIVGLEEAEWFAVNTYITIMILWGSRKQGDGVEEKNI